MAPLRSPIINNPYLRKCNHHNNISSAITGDAIQNYFRDEDSNTTIDADTYDDSPQKFIVEVMQRALNIKHPRPYQVEAINEMAFNGKSMFLFRKTGEGKSAVPWVTALLLRLVSIILVPLVGLGSDQVSKAHNDEFRMDAYHVDELQSSDFLLLQKRILAFPHT